MDIFNIKTEQEFINSCINTFRYQYENIEVYRKFVDYLGIIPSKISDIEKIPFLPIEMFKNHKIIDGNLDSSLYFQSSGTTQMNLSKHWICDESVSLGILKISFS